MKNNAVYLGDNVTDGVWSKPAEDALIKTMAVIRDDKTVYVWHINSCFGCMASTTGYADSITALRAAVKTFRERIKVD